MRQAVAVLFVSLASLTALAADWPQFRGPTRDGVSSEKGLIRAFGPEGPKVLWTAPVGPGYGGAAVRDGEVFLLDRKGTAGDVLRVLDLETGKEKWNFEYATRGTVPHEGSRSTPTVDDKYVYTVGPLGQAHCISRETHKAVWKKDLLADFGGEFPRWGVSQSVLLDGERAILAPQSPTVGLVALDKATGKLAWKTGPVGTMKYASPVLTDLAGKRQVVMLTMELMTGSDAASGELLWKYEGYTCKNAIPDVLPLGDGRLLITGGYDAGSAVIRVEAKDGKFKAVETARNKEIGSQVHTPLLHGGHIYALCNTNTADDGLVCFDLDLKVKWQTKKLSNGGMVLTADGIIYSPDGKTGELRIIAPNPEAYKELAKSAPLVSGKVFWAPLTLSGGRLLIRGHTQIKCVDLRAK